MYSLLVFHLQVQNLVYNFSLPRQTVWPQKHGDGDDATKFDIRDSIPSIPILEEGRTISLVVEKKPHRTTWNIALESPTDVILDIIFTGIALTLAHTIGSVSVAAGTILASPSLLASLGGTAPLKVDIALEADGYNVFINNQLAAHMEHALDMSAVESVITNGLTVSNPTVSPKVPDCGKSLLPNELPITHAFKATIENLPEVDGNTNNCEMYTVGGEDNTFNRIGLRQENGKLFSFTRVNGVETEKMGVIPMGGSAIYQLPKDKHSLMEVVIGQFHDRFSLSIPSINVDIIKPYFKGKGSRLLGMFNGLQWKNCKIRDYTTEPASTQTKRTLPIDKKVVELNLSPRHSDIGELVSIDGYFAASKQTMIIRLMDAYQKTLCMIAVNNGISKVMVQMLSPDQAVDKEDVFVYPQPNDHGFISVLLTVTGKSKDVELMVNNKRIAVQRMRLDSLTSISVDPMQGFRYTRNMVLHPTQFKEDENQENVIELWKTPGVMSGLQVGSFFQFSVLLTQDFYLAVRENITVDEKTRRYKGEPFPRAEHIRFSRTSSMKTVSIDSQTPDGGSSYHEGEEGDIKRMYITQNNIYTEYNDFPPDAIENDSLLSFKILLQEDGFLINLNDPWTHDNTLINEETTTFMYPYRSPHYFPQTNKLRQHYLAIRGDVYNLRIGRAQKIVEI